MAANEHEQPAPERRKTQAERYHELAVAGMTRTPPRAAQTVEVSRNAAGNYQYAVGGIAGEAETLDACANRVLATARTLDTELPLSEDQQAKRNPSAGFRPAPAGERRPRAGSSAGGS